MNRRYFNKLCGLGSLSFLFPFNNDIKGGTTKSIALDTLDIYLDKDKKEKYTIYLKECKYEYDWDALLRTFDGQDISLNYQYYLSWKDFVEKYRHLVKNNNQYRYNRYINFPVLSTLIISTGSYKQKTSIIEPIILNSVFTFIFVGFNIHPYEMLDELKQNNGLGKVKLTQINYGGNYESN